MAKIEGALAFDPRLGANLEQVLTNAENARLAQIRRLEGHWERAGHKINSLHMEIIHLLDFGINATTRNVLRELIRIRPVAAKLTPPIEDKERNRLAMDLQQWLQGVRNVAEVAAYGGEIARISRQALYDGQQQVRDLDPKERPEKIDALPFADFYAVAHQCDATAAYLAEVVELLDNADEQKLRYFREFYDARSKR